MSPAAAETKRDGAQVREKEKGREKKKRREKEKGRKQERLSVRSTTRTQSLHA